MSSKEIESMANEILQDEKKRFGCAASLSPGNDEFKQSAEIFPKKEFPWEVLTLSIQECLKQLARACATSPGPLPGVAMAILASAIGSTFVVSAKISWQEPLIFWFIDIRPSGEGKTPSARALCRVVHERQKRAEEEYKTRMAEWEELTKEERGKHPDPPRGYFVTDLTLEGLREDHSGHGGKVIIQDELSAFLNSQNQYKKKGNDREAWLELYDGHPARVVRTGGRTVSIEGVRLSIFGGTQPVVWARCFGGDDGVYLSDGTVFRFLPYFGGEAFYPNTDEAWADDSRSTWEKTLNSAFDWADNMHAEGKTIVCQLTGEAQSHFNEWANNLKTHKPELHEALRGYIPKAIGWALRLAGIIHCMQRFSSGKEPEQYLNIDDIKKGIKTAEFHLSHAVTAMKSLLNEGAVPEIDFTPDVLHLGVTLRRISGEAEGGKLSVGYINEKYNEDCPDDFHIKSPQAMGALMRRCKLNILPGLHDLKQNKRVRCLLVDEKTRKFVEDCLISLGSLEGKRYQDVSALDKVPCVSLKSRISETDEKDLSQFSISQLIEIIEERESRDNRDNFLDCSKKIIEGVI